MESIRKAEAADASRLAEILIFAKRVRYRPIFQNDLVSFGAMQVLPLALEYRDSPKKREGVWVYDDGFVKGMVHLADREVRELYVDPFFQGQGIGGALLDFAVREHGADCLWVLEKNEGAIAFYRSHGFSLTGERRLEEGTSEYIARMGRPPLA